MNATNPLTIDGETYPYYTLSLAISGRIIPDGSTDASVAMRLVPTRVSTAGEVITAEAEARAVVLGTQAGADEPTLIALGTIRNAIQTYLNVKGI